MPKCYSICRKREKSKCNRPCKYIDGKYKYCRLGSTHKLNSNCEIVKKMTKKSAAKKIARFINQTNTRKNTEDIVWKGEDGTDMHAVEQVPRSESRKQSAAKKIARFLDKTVKTRKHRLKQSAAKKIARFLGKNRMKIKGKYLESICSDSGVCLAFGNNASAIKDFFNGFTSLKYAISPMTRLGQPSSNGFVNEIKYNRENYLAHSIVKSSANTQADNLFYEYRVGLFLNEKSKFYPCFLETYGLFIYNDEAAWRDTKSTIRKDINVFERGTTLLNGDKSLSPQEFKDLLSRSCLDSKHLAVMIQHIKNAKTLGTVINDLRVQRNLSSTTQFYFTDLMNILFQIYYPLSELASVFTHYDLHTDNVILYQPFVNGHIEFHYEITPTKFISFKSKYISKIIDYGRSYFKQGNHNSFKIHNMLCGEVECAPNCGENYGYTWLDPTYNDMHINSSLRNMSHDLRLLNILKDFHNEMSQYFAFNSIRGEYNQFFPRVVYTGTYGTEELFSGPVGDIVNIVNANDVLVQILEQQMYQNKNDQNYTHSKKMGDLYIYKNGRPMKYIAV
jgi:hypothetical protein